ncbi:MAG: acyltransferase [Anaerolineae bacterium]|nr:acyltransferase [Anaerolineae bacterium]
MTALTRHPGECRQLQRTGLRQAIFLLAGPFRLLWRPLSSAFVALLAWVDEWIWGMEAVTERISHARGRQLPLLLRAFGASIAPEVDLRQPFHLHNPQHRLRDLSIGWRTHIGKDCLLDLTAPITIGQTVTLAMRVTIITHLDTYYSPLRLEALPSRTGAVIVEDGAYIGAGAVILHNVTIGRCAVVAAGALVREDVPPYTVVAGVPARVIKTLDAHTLQPDHTQQRNQA